jgi:uncharacterized protein YkwD
MLMALEDLASATYSTVEWDGNTQTVAFTSGPLPYYDGNNLPDEYRNWLIETTYRNFKPYGAVAPWDAPALTDEEMISRVAAEVLRLANEERDREGLHPLTVVQTISDAAQIRAGELIDLFSHSRPNGEDTHTAYSGVLFDFHGENILRVTSGRNPEMVANFIIDVWMNSSGHRANILSPDARYMGAGVALGDNHLAYCALALLR